MNEFLFNILAWINSWVGSWGWAMVIFTIMVRLVLTPLDLKSRISMRKTTKLQPKMAELQKKYANDKEKLNAKTAELYKKEGVNPLSSCLPLLLTWPILIFVFNAMRMAANKEILEQITGMMNNGTLTMEPWLWVKNLWMPDSLFSLAVPDAKMLNMIPTDQWVSWFNGLGDNIPALLQELNLTADSFSKTALTGTVTAIVEKLNTIEVYKNALAGTGYSVPLLGSIPRMFNGLMLLPILSAVTQIIMTKVSGTNQQSAGNDQTAATGKFMQWFFPLFSLVLCFGYSAAFALYWVAGNVVMMVQTLVINKVLDKKEEQQKIVGEGTVK